MIFVPINRYVQFPELLADVVKTYLGESRFFGIEANLEGEFFLVADDITQAEKDYIDAIEYPIKKRLRINSLLRVYSDPFQDALNVDFISGLTVKLHRKSILVKGECRSEEFYLNFDGTTYSTLIVKEESTYTRDALGFPIYKDVKISWVCEDGSFHSKTKEWRKYYSQLEKIQEGKTRRGNLLDNLQMPCIGLISYALLGHFNGSPEVILEGRRFLADYALEFKVFVDDSNKEIISCLNNPQHIRYASVSNYSWIDSMTPYGVTIRQFIINELTI